MKVLLIENRKDRMNSMLGSEYFSKLAKIESLSIMDINNEMDFEKWNVFFKKLEDNIEDLKGFEILMIHKSKLNEKSINTIKNHCISNGCKLILFSGALTDIMYENDSFESLSINSSDFYKVEVFNRLVSISKPEDSNLLNIIYGAKSQIHMLQKCIYESIRIRHLLRSNNDFMETKIFDKTIDSLNQQYDSISIAFKTKLIADLEEPEHEGAYQDESQIIQMNIDKNIRSLELELENQIVNF